MIAKSTIDSVFETARLEEVIGDFVQLKKSGSNFKGLSPFSDERTPSFMVSPAKQIWKDFSSGKGGNVVAFLMEHEHFSYPEAIKYLARKYNIEIEETVQSDEQKEQANERESMYLVSEYARTYFQDILWNHPKGKAIGKSYFLERGFTEETIKTFGLGYSLDEWTAFTDKAIEEGYQLDYLAKTGLTIVKDTKQFDRFKGRVLFPIQSMSGRVLGFGGRILTNDKKAAKYLNSPDSEIYHKSKVLYGIYHAKQAIAKEDVCYLVEGYTDVIQMHQRGVKNVVASSGTALTTDQIRLIRRLTNNITVLFDGDAAGLRASLRGIDLILEAGMNVRVCSFPEGEDPDSFAKNTPFETLVLFLQENAKDFIQFKASLLAEQSGNDPIKKAETIREIVKSISKIPDRIKKEVYVKTCAQIMDISEEVLFNTLAQIGKKEVQDAYKKQQQQQQSFQVVKADAESVSKVDIQYELEQKIIEILLLYGSEQEDFEELVLKENDQGELVLEPVIIKSTVYEKLFLDLQQDEIALTNDSFRMLYHQILEELQKNGALSIEVFINKLSPELSDHVTRILMKEELYQLHDWESKNIFVKKKDKVINQLVMETVLNLRCFLIDEKVRELQQKTAEKKQQTHQDVLEEIINYHQLKKLLSNKLNRVV
ncbi:MAG: DNA primase [Flavobacteriaceae bacterium]|nr:DNA primase [Flavobacteriaceae bacterium]MDG2314110.1 DNA primase [Flavobacteriaceae bacterium]